MPFYAGLRDLAEVERTRAIDGLLKLRQQFRADGVPPKNVDDTLLLATWNIREFDSSKYGSRCAECYYYIAEIISHFDLVAVQEVRGDLDALARLLRLLGGWWKFIVTDVTLGTSGNDERLAFLYDSRKVAFDGLAGELVLPAQGQTKDSLQFARTPFICGFKAGWAHFKLCTVHIYYGKSTPVDERRVKEIGDLAKTLAAVATGGSREVKSAVGDRAQSKRLEAENLILLGDFNIFNRKDATFEALTGAGFTVPEELAQPGTNLDANKHYDQIAFMARPGRFGTTGRAGVFDFQKSVFGRGELARYADLVDQSYFTSKSGKPKKPDTVYNDWRTHQMSDHLLLWSELKMNYGEDYLRDLAAAPPAPAPR